MIIIPYDGAECPTDGKVQPFVFCRSLCPQGWLASVILCHERGSLVRGQATKYVPPRSVRLIYSMCITGRDAYSKMNADRRASMAHRINLTVPAELKEKMDQWRDRLNFSKIFQAAAEQEITKRQAFLERKEKEESVDDIMGGADLSTNAGQYATGKDLGFFYAKTAPYPEIRRFEQYVGSFGDKNTMERMHGDLGDIQEIVERMGACVVADARDTAEGIATELTHHFDHGFLTGVMEFIRDEPVDVDIT